jgi:predicted nucleic acid-binding protein
MTAPVFVDTNVLVYARDTANPAKQARAAAWMRHLWERRAGRLSTQVLQEYYVAVTAKLQPGLDSETARNDVRALLTWDPFLLDAATIEDAWSVQDRYGLSWWDGLIVAAARTGRCGILLSEDLSDGQDYGGTTVVNPFRLAPEGVGSGR